MAKPLLIFVGSPNVGSYINVMANSVQNHDVESIALINVLESPSGQQVDFANFANSVLWNTLSNLVEGKYIDRGQEVSVPKTVKHTKRSSRYLEIFTSYIPSIISFSEMVLKNLKIDMVLMPL